MASVLTKIKNGHLMSRVICLLICTFLLTLTYNMFLVPNKIVTGGVSGLAIVIEELFGISTSIFISISNVILIILSIICLGKKKTFEQLFGCITYILMINITAPIANRIGFAFESKMVMLIIVSILYGILSGLIYRAGYSTGGTDFISLILSDKLKVPMTKSSLFVQILIISISAFVLGIHKIMLSVFIIYVSNRITNSVLFGVSTSKMVYVVSNECDEIQDYIVNIMGLGITEIKTHKEFLKSNKPMLMCVLHNAQFNKFKREILTIDPTAFILVNNCYEVSGGRKLNILPF